MSQRRAIVSCNSCGVALTSPLSAKSLCAFHVCEAVACCDSDLLATRMSNASVIQYVFAFVGNHISVLSDVNGRIVLPLILVAELVPYVKRTDNSAEGGLCSREL